MAWRHLASFCFFLFVAVFLPHNASGVQRVKLGIDVLSEMQFQPLWGKRIGLLTHQAGVNRVGMRTADLMHQHPRVALKALFAPEHGFYSQEKAFAKIEDMMDQATGLKIYSLYGASRKPTPSMLKGLDVLVVDIQDVGVRSYSYISCVKLCIEACFENGIEVIILDRPNPLGGHKVAGPPLNREWENYLGAYPVPYVYGLTLAELVRMAKHEGWLDTDVQGSLRIVPMQGWRREMTWADTGLDWTPTSPNIPDAAATFGYAMTGLGAQLGGFRHGVGTQYPFRLLSHPEANTHELIDLLSNLNLTGLEYRAIRTKTKTGKEHEGVYLVVKDWDAVNPAALSFEMMRLACLLNKDNPFKWASESQMRLYNKHVGSSPWWQEISTRGQKANVKAFLHAWTKYAHVFREKSSRYYLYR